MVALYFKEFPMDKMPPFIREKFTSEVAAKVQVSVPSASLVVFLDADSSAEMARVDLAKK